MSKTEGFQTARRLIAQEAERRSGKLDLTGLGLTELPTELWELQHLRELRLGAFAWAPPAAGRQWLGNNTIPAMDPIAGLKRLQYLDCSHNPITNLAPIASLTDLRHLSCSATEVADLAPIAGLTELRHLNCLGTKVADLAPIAGLTKLRHLSCSRTEVADLAPIAGLAELRHLGCSGTKVADLAPITDLVGLQWLDCSGTKVADLAPIARLSGLRHLRCSGTRVEDLASIAGLSGLRHLSCSGTRVEDLASIAGLSGLRHLSCSGTKVADLMVIARLAGLQELDCSHSQVTDLSPITRLRELWSLTFSGCPVADLAPVAGLTKLRRLICSGTKVADLMPLTALAKLQELDCSHSQVADLSPITGLIELQFLDCSGTQVADLGPVTSLKRLLSLRASNARIRRLPRALGNFRQLEELGVLGGLHLKGNPLDPPLPALIAPGNPEATRRVLAWLRGELDAASLDRPSEDALAPDAEGPPPLPAPGTGPAVVVAPDGRLVLAAPSDLDAAGNNRTRLDALHPAVRQAAIDLLAALRDQPTNQANDRLLRAAERYREMVDMPLAEVNFARLYAVGIQLENAERATRAGLAAGRADVPDLTPIQDECLGTLLQLHPPFVLASRDGTEMLADQTLIQFTGQEVSAVRDAGLAVGAAMIARPDLAEPALGQMIRDSAEEIGQGPNTARDAATSVSMTRNVVIALGASATAISLPLIGITLLGGAGGIAGGVASWGLLKVVEKTKAFAAVQTLFATGLDRVTEADLAAATSRLRGHRTLLLSIEVPLRRLAKLPAFSWLDRTLDWLKRQTDQDQKL